MQSPCVGNRQVPSRRCSTLGCGFNVARRVADNELGDGGARARFRLRLTLPFPWRTYRSTDREKICPDETVPDYHNPTTATFNHKGSHRITHVFCSALP